MLRQRPSQRPSDQFRRAQGQQGRVMALHLAPVDLEGLAEALSSSAPLSPEQQERCAQAARALAESGCLIVRAFCSRAF